MHTEDTEQDPRNPAYRVGSFYANGSTTFSDPFLSFVDTLDFGPDCEQFRIRDLGDFTDRFDRTAEASASGDGEQEEDVPQLVEPTALLPGAHAVQLSEPSALLSDSACRALAAAFPIRHRWRQWVLLYSSGRHGISLQTLYRYRPGRPYLQQLLTPMQQGCTKGHHSKL